MSTGGIFQLITNDGKQDKLLMATEYLSARLADIKKSRQGLEDENPTLADIEKTHVLFMNAHFKPFAAMAYEYNKVSLSNATLGSQLQFSIPQFGDFFNDMVLHMVLEAPTTSITFSGNATTDVPIYRWCDYPGERICQRVSFDVNGNPLDDYYSDTYNMHRQFRVGADKMVGWNRNMGQEVEQQAYHQYRDTPDVGILPFSSRAAFGILNGHQTYKPIHDDLELFIPLLFWFNTDPALSIPSVAIPYGQRYIKVDLASKEQLLRVISNPAAINATTAPTITSPAITTCELYINNIFVQPDIHDIFIKRIGFSLVRVHRRQITNVNKASDNILLQQLKWPIETMYIGIRPTANITPNTVRTSHNDQLSIVDPAMEDWHRFSLVSNSNPDGSTLAGHTTPYHIKSEVNHVTTISVEAHGIQLYNNLPSQFFNSYIPYTYGGWNIVTPTDPGLFMITFNLFPGSYQPSGHINVSRAREFYFKYTSTWIEAGKTGDLIVNASAINFLLISDGSAIMRYTT
jgi:hypothetical protein